MLNNKTLLITGGTGSFGNAVVKFFLKSKLKTIIIFSRDEKKQDDMRNQINNSKLKFVIGDVRNYRSIYSCLEDVDFVFHAAALKQVPTCEFHPLEAVKTNILGTENVINASIEKKVKKIVVLSTDKAVYPINAMGMSKALAEKIVVSKSRFLNKKNITICATRYGNVMGSRGSVIPLFVSQIKNNKDLTVTNPNMTRFLMSLDDSVKLVYHAFKNGKNGDIFVQKSPASTISTIGDAILAHYKSNNKIKTLGIRHGEKMHETLVNVEEMARAIDQGDYFRIPVDNRDLNYKKYFNVGQKNNLKNDYTSENTKRLNKKQVISLLKKNKLLI